MTPYQPAPDLVLYNGKFHTQDPNHPAVEAIAIASQRIVATGTSIEIKKLTGNHTKVIDLQGRRVIPGMVDSHFHYHEWSFMRQQVNLATVNSFPACIERLKQETAKKSAGAWVIGQGFNESEWPENRMPLLQDLDAITTDHPMIIWRCDLHLAVVNSKALAMARIDANTPNPPEGIIEKDSHGNLTGVLRELAINLVKKPILDLMDKDIVQAMRDSMPVLNALGLTGVHDIRLMGGLEGASALGAWQKLDEKDELTLRAWVTLPGEHIDQAITLGLKTGFGNDKLRIGHLKYFADGGMGARTAYMIEPYLDAECGMPLTPMADLEKAITKADQAGLAVMVHAIGDRTNRELIDLFTKLSGTNGSRPVTASSVPHRIEHLQMIRPEDIQRLAKLKQVVGCVQPHNLVLDINMVKQSVGDKGKYLYAFRKMIDAGLQLIFSSDCPVCDPSPLVGIHAAVTRERPDRTPDGGWYPDQKITVAEAVYGYTMAPALACKSEDRLGSISPGKLADLVVLDQDIFTIEPAKILETNVDLTLMNGKIVHRSPHFPRA